MNKLDKLQDLLETEIINQNSYNEHICRILNPEARQLFTQLRDEHMQHITQLQKQIQQLMTSGIS